MELSEINPDDIKLRNRIHLRNELVKTNFDAEHYLFDLIDNEEEVRYKKNNSVIIFSFLDILLH